MSAKCLIRRSYYPSPKRAHLFRIRLSFVLMCLFHFNHSPSLVLITRYYAIDMGQRKYRSVHILIRSECFCDGRRGSVLPLD